MADDPLPQPPAVSQAAVLSALAQLTALKEVQIRQEVANTRRILVQTVVLLFILIGQTVTGVQRIDGFDPAYLHDWWVGSDLFALLAFVLVYSRRDGYGMGLYVPPSTLTKRARQRPPPGVTGHGDDG